MLYNTETFEYDMEVGEGPNSSSGSSVAYKCHEGSMVADSVRVASVPSTSKLADHVTGLTICADVPIDRHADKMISIILHTRFMIVKNYSFGVACIIIILLRRRRIISI